MGKDDVEVRLRQLGNRLRALRLERGLSLLEVERLSGGALKGVVIGSYERGDRNVTVTRLTEIAAIYDIEISDLLSDAGGRRSAGSVVEAALHSVGIEARVTDWHHPVSATRGVTIRVDTADAHRLAGLLARPVAGPQRAAPGPGVQHEARAASALRATRAQFA